MIWSFPPREPMTEGLEFFTDVMRAYSEEQRVQLLAVPRRRFEHEYVFTARDYERARLAMRGVHPGSFDLPDWTDFRPCTAESGDTTLVFDNTDPEFDSSQSILIWQDSETYEELTVSASSSSGLTLSAPLDNDYPRGRVMRLLESYPIDGMTAQHPAGTHRSASVEWVCYDDDLATADSSEFSTYRDEFLLDACPAIGGDALPESVRRAFQVVDNGIARPFYDTTLGQPSETFGLAWQPSTRAEAWSLRRQFLALRGRQVAFWMPSFNTGGLELAATASAGAGSVTIRAVSLGVGYPDGQLDIYIRLNNGTVIARQVTAITPGAGTEVLTLSGTMPQTVTQADIHRFCTLGRMRLAQDRIEWLHRAKVGPKVVVAANEAPLPA
jgi:hypothetical protein